MSLPRPSKYQLFLTSLVILIIAILLIPILIPKEDDPTKIKIGIVDSGCTFQQRSHITEFKTFTTTHYGYDYTDPSIYDAAGHGELVCQIIIDGTENVQIYSAKIANGQGDITYDGLFAAIDYLVKEKDVDIINLSLGSEPYISADLLSAFEEYASSKIFIASVGNKALEYNYANGIIDWPANLPWVIGVGSITEEGRAEYSSFGRSNTGLFGTDFVEDGEINGARGTSFATPRVTVAYTNMWQLLSETFDNITPELLNFHLANSIGPDQFSEEIGWGRPEGNISHGTKVLIAGIDEYEPFTRFKEEAWTKTWKIYSTDDSIELSYSGNASAQVINQQLTDYKWGKLLTVNFNGEGNSGNYTLHIDHTEGNEISYTYSLSSDIPERKILLDHRNTINGFAHEYGQYMKFESIMRGYGVMVDQIQVGEHDINQYDSVIVTEFGRTDEDKIFYRDYNKVMIDSYFNYVESGGNLQIMVSYPSLFNYSEYKNILGKFGANVINQRVPNQGDITYVQNLTNFEIFNDVEALGIGGIAIEPMNSSQSVLGWYKYIADDIFSQTKYFAIGTNTTFGQGKIHVWSGSVMIHNDYIQNNLQNYDRFLLNYLGLELN